jgi:hypothetical protein
MFHQNHRTCHACFLIFFCMLLPPHCFPWQQSTFTPVPRESLRSPWFTRSKLPTRPKTGRVAWPALARATWRPPHWSKRGNWRTSEAPPWSRERALELNWRGFFWGHARGNTEKQKEGCCLIIRCLDVANKKKYTYLSIYVSIRPSIHPSVYPSIHLSIYPST